MSRGDRERDRTTTGRVKQSKTQTIERWFTYCFIEVCQRFSEHSDSSLAYRLQEEECRTDDYKHNNFFFLISNVIDAVHFDRNRTNRRESRLGVQAARDVEQEERQTFIAKQYDFYRQKQKTFVVVLLFLSGL